MKRLTAGLSAAALLLPLAAFACPTPQSLSWWDVVETYQLMLPRASNFWSPIAWSLGVLALAVVSVRERKSPGFAQVFFSPGFLIAAGLSTVGAFFFRWLPLGGHLQMGLSLPLPDLDQFFFGPSMDANPLFYSALVPAIASTLGMRWQGARRVIAGLCCGFGGTIAAAAWHGFPELSVLSARWASLPWLAVNAAVCCFIARAMFVAEARDVGPTPKSA
ncbi:MAG TPA: hypothetical protein VIG99_06000 [Myxococcaceae bacterium]|jgi:hypothetical protein